MKASHRPVKRPSDFMTPESYQMNLRWAMKDPRWTDVSAADKFMVDNENIQRAGMRQIRRENDPLHLDYSKLANGAKDAAKIFCFTGVICCFASVAMDAKDTHGFNHAETMKLIAEHKAYLKHHKHVRDKKVVIPLFVWMDHQFAKMAKEEKFRDAKGDS